MVDGCRAINFLIPYLLGWIFKVLKSVLKSVLKIGKTKRMKAERFLCLLYAQLKRKVTHRSLLLLYTNFEHISSLKRQLPYLQAISKKHMLVVIIFENTELDELIAQDAEDLQSIYHKTIAEKFSFEKRLMIKELQKHGIQTILTAPENLTINTINKYLEIKARGLL